jgi:hypothetical protein
MIRNLKFIILSL